MRESESSRNEARAERATRGAVAADALERVTGEIALPPGHRLRFDRKRELTWDGGGPGNSVSAYIERSPGDPDDAEQMRVVIRIHVCKPIPCATLQVERGALWVGKSTEVLAQPHCPRAETYDGLMAEIRDTLNVAMSPWTGRELEGARP